LSPGAPQSAWGFFWPRAPAGDWRQLDRDGRGLLRFRNGDLTAATEHPAMIAIDIRSQSAAAMWGIAGAGMDRRDADAEVRCGSAAATRGAERNRDRRRKLIAASRSARRRYRRQPTILPATARSAASAFSRWGQEASSSQQQDLHLPIGQFIIADMDDKQRRDKISKTGLIVGLTGVAISFGHLLDQPGEARGLSLVGVLLLFGAVTLNIWRSDT
jgi:hypothetical protein